MHPYTSGNPRIHKRYTAEGGGRVAMWTPAASARIVLTDMSISGAISGTFRVEFGTSNGFIVGDHFTQGSVMVYPFSSTMIDSLQMDCPLVISFGPNVAQSNANTFVTAEGWEERA